MEVEMIGKIFNVVLLIGKKVIKVEVLWWMSLVVFVYIVVYGCMEISEIVFILDLNWVMCILKKEDYFLIIVDVLSV